MLWREECTLALFTGSDHEMRMIMKTNSFHLPSLEIYIHDNTTSWLWAKAEWRQIWQKKIKKFLSHYCSNLQIFFATSLEGRRSFSTGSFWEVTNEFVKIHTAFHVPTEISERKSKRWKNHTSFADQLMSGHHPWWLYQRRIGLCNYVLIFIGQTDCFQIWCLPYALTWWCFRSCWFCSAHFYSLNDRGLLANSSSRRIERQNGIHYTIGLFEFNVILFGLHRVPAIFQRLMDQLLENEHESKDAIDHLTVAIPDFAACIRDLRKLFQAI